MAFLLPQWPSSCSCRSTGHLISTTTLCLLWLTRSVATTSPSWTQSCSSPTDHVVHRSVPYAGKPPVNAVIDTAALWNLQINDQSPLPWFTCFGMRPNGLSTTPFFCASSTTLHTLFASNSWRYLFIASASLAVLYMKPDRPSQ